MAIIVDILSYQSPYYTAAVLNEFPHHIGHHQLFRECPSVARGLVSGVISPISFAFSSRSPVTSRHAGPFPTSPCVSGMRADPASCSATLPVRRALSRIGHLHMKRVIFAVSPFVFPDTWLIAHGTLTAHIASTAPQLFIVSQNGTTCKAALLFSSRKHMISTLACSSRNLRADRFPHPHSACSIIQPVHRSSR